MVSPGRTRWDQGCPAWRGRERRLCRPPRRAVQRAEP